ncbi:MAG: leucine-rich repeat domain-containing protein [Candidatus Hermodarchaeota archaeon]
MSLNPKEIYEKFSQKVLDKNTALILLESIIENSEDNKLRLESIDILKKIGINDKYTYQFIENLLISDSNPEIRKLALDLVYKDHPEKILKLIKWIVKNEMPYSFLIAVIKTLEIMGNEESKRILIEELKKVKKVKYLNEEKRYENRKYKKVLKRLFKTSKIETFTHKQISDIISNFLIIKHLSGKFPNVFFELNPQTALVEQLDLSNYLEYEVKGTPWGWNNNISNILEIEGLEHLNAIKKLDLSNNQIQNIKELGILKSLTHLILSNNKIKDQGNLGFLDDLSNLEYLDLSGNEVVIHLKTLKLNPKIRIVSKRYWEDLNK